MNTLQLLWIFTSIQLLLIDSISATCIITKDVTRTEARIRICDQYCHYELKIIETGPLEYSCINTNTEEIHHFSQLKTNVENKIFVNDSSIPSLNSISMYDWKNLTELHMTDTQTSEIVPGFFSRINDLQVLEITNNELETILDGVFSSLSKLEMLNLSENYINELTQHCFSGLLSLEVLDLSKNKIASVSSKIFEYQIYLKRVDLSQNLIKDVGNIFDKPTIQYIHLSKNQLIDFDFEQLKDKKNLYIVDLSDNFLEDVQNIHLINASYVSLAKNKIKKLNKIGNISFFNLSYNLIDMLERSMLSSDIQTLDLSHNDIKLISRETLLNCNNLIHLDISFNRVSQIPFGLFNNLNVLSYLDISNNQMILDFHTLTTLKSLEVLKFQNINIKNFDANMMMTRFKNLKSVSLGGNFWRCNELSITIHILRSHNVSVSPGNKTKESNILGIPCKDGADIKEDTIITKSSNLNNSQNNNKDKELENKIYDTNFQNISLILERLDNISKQLSNQNNNYIPQNMNESSFNQYFNTNFTNSSFYKYMESLKLIQNKTFDFNSKMMVFLGDGFNQTNFYKYLNSLKLNQINITSDHVTHIQSNVSPTQLNQTEVLLNSMNKTVSNMSQDLHQILLSLTSSKNVYKENLESRTNLENLTEPMKYESQAQTTTRISHLDKTFTDNQIFTNILLTLIVCCLVAHLYYNFWKPKKHSEINQEQVQLM